MVEQVLDRLNRKALLEQAVPTQARWEWRTFGTQFGLAEKRLAGLTPNEIKESDEIYFISPIGENVKVRDGLMDVKILREVSPFGLEQWTPVMKAEFPLSAVDAQKVVQALRIPVYGLKHERYSLQDALEALGGTTTGVRVVNVHKRRMRYTVEECMAELSDITADGIPVRTIAIESEDPDAVLRAIGWLGLTGYTNINYPRGLTDLIDKVSERYAVIDVGTNSIKLHIAERRVGRSWATIADRADLTRLGEGLTETGRISDAALDRAVEAIKGMMADCKRSRVRAIAAVGTAGLRIASNAAEIVSIVREQTGVQIEVLSGDEEARLAYSATISALGPTVGHVVIFDTGGGSSQFTFGHGRKVDDRFSVDVGAARYTEQFGLDDAVSDDVVHQAMGAIDADLSILNGRPVPDALIGMGGAVTNITAVALGLAKYDAKRVQGAVITNDQIDQQIELYRSRDADTRRSIVGLQPERAEVIVAGACIVHTVLKKLGKASLTASDRGLRHGLLLERFGQ